MAEIGADAIRILGRYALYGEIASGGMATVHLARLLGSAGFSRIVAIKALHPQLAKDAAFVAMFTDEARLASRIRHPNVVAAFDVVSSESELYLVMEYVQGESFHHLQRHAAKADDFIPVSIVVAIIHGVLSGLHAAHEARSELGEPLHIIHRDISPQNVLVGVDGVARLVDFGIAKAVGRIQTTHEGQLKGKTAYMAPEHLRGREIDRRVDTYAVGVVMWEALAGVRLFDGDAPGVVMAKVLEMPVLRPSERASGRADPIGDALDAFVLKAIDRDPDRRFQDAREMARALEQVATPHATPREVGDYVMAAAREELAARAARVHAIEKTAARSIPTSQRPPPAATSAASSLGRPTPSRVPIGAFVVGLALVAASAAAVATRYARTIDEDRAPATPPSKERPLGSADGGADVGTAPPHSNATATRGPGEAPAEIGPPPPATARASANSSPHRPSSTNAPMSTAKGSPKRPPNCNPPYTVDRDGVHIPKAGCD